MIVYVRQRCICKGEGDVKMEAENRVMQPQSKEFWLLMDDARQKERIVLRDPGIV